MRQPSEVGGFRNWDNVFIGREREPRSRNWFAELERTMGIERTSEASEASVLLLTYACSCASHFDRDTLPPSRSQSLPLGETNTNIRLGVKP